jgi:hypothetical protein
MEVPRVLHNPNMRVSRAIHGHRVRVWRTAPNSTGVEGAVVNGASLPTIRFTEQNPALCGIYFNRAIRTHGAPIDKELQLAGGRCVALDFEFGNLGFHLSVLGFKLRNLFHLVFHLGFHLREFLAHLRKGAMARRRFASNKCHSRKKHEQLHGPASYENEGLRAVSFFDFWIRLGVAFLTRPVQLSRAAAAQ